MLSGYDLTDEVLQRSAGVAIGSGVLQRCRRAYRLSDQICLCDSEGRRYCCRLLLQRALWERLQSGKDALYDEVRLAEAVRTPYTHHLPVEAPEYARLYDLTISSRLSTSIGFSIDQDP